MSEADGSLRVQVNEYAQMPGSAHQRHDIGVNNPGAVGHFPNIREQIAAIFVETDSGVDSNLVIRNIERHRVGTPAVELSLDLPPLLDQPIIEAHPSSAWSLGIATSPITNLSLQHAYVATEKDTENVARWRLQDQKPRQRYNLSRLQQQYQIALTSRALAIQQSKGIADCEEAMKRAKRRAGGLVLKAGVRLDKLLEVIGHGGPTGPGSRILDHGASDYLDEIKSQWEITGSHEGMMPVWQYVKEWEISEPLPSPYIARPIIGVPPMVQQNDRYGSNTEITNQTPPDKNSGVSDFGPGWASTAWYLETVGPQG